METKTSIFTATHGVMTQEVGVISGELELRTTCQEDGTLELKIAYVGASYRRLYVTRKLSCP